MSDGASPSAYLVDGSAIGDGGPKSPRSTDGSRSAEQPDRSSHELVRDNLSEDGRDIEGELLAGAACRSFSVWVDRHRRAYDFGELVQFYGSTFVRDLVETWAAVAAHESKPWCASGFRAVKRALLAIAAFATESPNGPSGTVAGCLRDDRRDDVDVPTLRQAIDAVVAEASAGGSAKPATKGRSSSKTFVWALSTALRRLAEHRFLPGIGPLSVRFADDPHAAGTPSLAELTRCGPAPVPVPTTAGLSLEAHVVGMRDLNVVRLDALRDCLENEFLGEHRAFLVGRAWISDPDLPSPDVVEAAVEAAALRKETREAGGRIGRWAARVRAALGLPDGSDLLPFAVRHFHGRHERGWRTRSLASWETNWLRLYGTDLIVQHLEATPRATTAAFGLLLIDTALNVSSLEDLPADPFVGATRHGKRRLATVAARKMRARGRRVEGTLTDGPLPDQESDLPVRVQGRLSGVEVVERYLDMTVPLRARARAQGLAEVADRFWVVAGDRSATGGRVHNNLAQMASDWWPSFVRRQADHPVIGGLPIVRRNIRTTVLQVRSARNGFGHAIAKAVASHASSRTTMGYLGARWIQAQLAAQIRQFQDLFEASLAETVPGAAELLGLGKTFGERTLRAREVGLDFICGHRPLSRTAPVDPSPTCTPLAPCAACPARRFVPGEEAFRALYLAHSALVRAEPTFVAQNARRWAAVWLPWRALTEAYVLKIARSPYKRRFEAAAATAEAELARGELALPLIA